MEFLLATGLRHGKCEKRELQKECCDILRYHEVKCVKKVEAVVEVEI